MIVSESPNGRCSRRGALKAIAALSAITAVFGTARQASSQAKVPKTALKYQDQPKNDQRCSGCTHFISGGQCKLVEGEISPNGWCTAYSPKR